MQLGFVANGFEVLATTIPCLILIMLHSAIVQAIPRSHEQGTMDFRKTYMSTAGVLILSLVNICMPLHEDPARAIPFTVVSVNHQQRAESSPLVPRVEMLDEQPVFSKGFLTITNVVRTLWTFVYTKSGTNIYK